MQLGATLKFYYELQKSLLFLLVTILMAALPREGICMVKIKNKFP
jgi:hypothetical protein